MTTNDHHELTRDEKRDLWMQQRQERDRLQKAARTQAKVIFDSIPTGSPTYIGALFDRYLELQNDVKSVQPERARDIHSHGHIRDVALDATAQIAAVLPNVDPESLLHEMVLEDLTGLFRNQLSARVLEHHMHHYVARITAALEEGGANPNVIEVVYGHQHGVVRVRRAPTDEPAELHSGWGDKADATGTYIAMIQFTRDGYDYSFLGTPRKTRVSYRSDGRFRTTAKLDTLLKLIAKQFYVPSESLQMARTELAKVDKRYRYLSRHLNESSDKVTKVYDDTWDRARDVNLRDLIDDVTNHNTEVLDYLVRKQRTSNRFRALVEPLLDAARERQAELHRIINKEQSKGLDA